MIKVIVTGSVNDYELFEKLMDRFLQHCTVDKVEIVSGGTIGIHYSNKRYAESRGITLKTIEADWDTFGKNAGFRRNDEMAQYATHLILFENDEPTDHKPLIELAHLYELDLRIVQFRPFAL